MSASDLEKVPIVLLCAPSGTGLTRISDWLKDADSRLVVRDLERAVCEIHRDPAKMLSRRMGKVTRDPRPILYDSWRIACEKVFEEVAEEAKSSASHPAVVSMHLSWYNPDTSEFFSPVDLVTLKGNNCSIVHIVILIDDIFDMYCALTGPDDLYGAQFNNHHQKLLAKLAPTLTTQDQQAQATEIALNELLSWRRAEMIQAENMARSLGAKLTMLGTKHDRRVLQSIVSAPHLPRIYLSHRISEHRRHERTTGGWVSVVHEVNALHQHFMEQAQLLINPTAIDELRFEEADREGRRNPLLGARWPMPEASDLMLCSVPLRGPDGKADVEATKKRDAEVDYEHTRILTNNSETVPVVSQSVARYLANRIFFEVAFRDHVIVENTPHLCVYRPFFCIDMNEAQSRSDWSSGVLREIQHWNRSQRKVVRNIPDETVPLEESVRRVAFIHSETEISGRIDRLFTGDVLKKFVSTVESLLRKIWVDDGMDNNEMTDLFAQQIPESKADPLGRDPNRLRIEEDPEGVFKSIGAAIQAALHTEFTSLVRPGMPDIDAGGPARYGVGQVALYVIEEEMNRCAAKLRELTRSLAEFFADQLGEKQVTEINDRFWEHCDAYLESKAETTFERFIADRLKIPYDRLEELAG